MFNLNPWVQSLCDAPRWTQGFKFTCMVIGMLLLVSLPAQAHKLKVFATAEGDRIAGEAYFVGGVKATGARIVIADGNGQVLASLVPDAEGRFSYQVSRRMDYQVIADSQDGHQARWTIQADELATALPQPETAEPLHAITEQVGPAPLGEQNTEVGPLDSPAMIALVERAVARQVRPLREEIAGYGEQVRMRDILGGLGYIAGIAGLGLWWRGRRQVGKS